MTRTVRKRQYPHEQNPQTHDPINTDIIAAATGALAPLALVVNYLEMSDRLWWLAVQGIAAATLIIVLPIVIGSYVSWKTSPNSSFEIGFRYLLGNFALLLVALALSLSQSFTIERMTLISWGLFAVGAGRIALRLYHRRDDLSAIVGRFKNPIVFCALGPVAVSLIASAYWRGQSPPPLQPIWDGLIHLVPIRAMLESDFFDLSLTAYTNAFQVNAYLPGLHQRIAIASASASIDPLMIFWGGIFPLLTIASIGVYTLVYKILRQPILAAAIASLVPFLQLLNKTPAPLIHLLPASEAAAFTPLLLSGILAQRKRLLPVAILLMLPLHALHGALLAGLIFVAYIGTKLLARTPTLRWLLLGIGILSALLLAFPELSRSYLGDDFVLQPFGYGTLTPDAGLSARLWLVDRFLPEVLIALATVAAALWIVGAVDRDHLPVDTLSLIALGVPIGYLIPIAGFERLHAFFLVSVPIGVALLSRIITSSAYNFSQVQRGRHIRTKRQGISVVLTVGVLSLIWVAFIPASAGALVDMREKQLSDSDLINVASSFAAYELAILPRIKQELTDLPVLSDPITSSLAEGFGGLTTPHGPYLTSALRRELAAALTDEEPEVVQARLKSIQESLGHPYILVITGRTLWWAFGNQGPFDFEFRPRHLHWLPGGPVSIDSGTILNRISQSGCIKNSAGPYKELIALSVDCR